MGTPRPARNPGWPDRELRKTASHDSALHHEGIIYGMMMSIPICFLQGISERTISQARIAPSGTEISATKKPMIRELPSGSQRTALDIWLAHIYFQ